MFQGSQLFPDSENMHSAANQQGKHSNKFDHHQKKRISIHVIFWSREMVQSMM